MSHYNISRRLKAELWKFHSFEEKHEYLKTLYDEDDWSTVGNAYLGMLNHLIIADVDPKFIVWLKDREILVQKGLTLEHLIETNNLNLIKELYDENIVAIFSMSPRNMLVSVEAVEFLYKNYNVRFFNGINCYEVLFDSSCDEEKSQRILKFLQSIDYRGSEPLQVSPITKKLIKFCVKNNLKIHPRSFRNLSKDTYRKLVKYNYTTFKPFKPFKKMSLNEKIEAVKNGNVLNLDVEDYLSNTRDHEFFRKIYPQLKEIGIFVLPSQILRTNDFNMIKVLADYGVKMKYSYHDQNDKYYKIFNSKMFETWKKIHDHNLVVWCQNELLCASYVLDHRFIKYALENCPAELRETFIRSL